jgi:hypothetical protein
MRLLSFSRIFQNKAEIMIIETAHAARARDNCLSDRSQNRFLSKAILDLFSNAYLLLPYDLCVLSGKFLALADDTLCSLSQNNYGVYA